MNNSSIMLEIGAEVERATQKWPGWPTDPIHAAAVIAEEPGELMKATIESVYEPHKGSYKNLRTEAIQTAAMCMRFIQSLDDYELIQSPLHIHAEIEEKP